MTTKEKKEYIVLALILVATFFVIYINFLKPKSSVQVPLSVAPEGVIGLPADDQAANSAAAVPTGAFLPNGTAFNLDVLDSDNFKSLIAPVYPKVSDSEIGSTNIFGK